jgi:hypothetical protein
MSIRARIDALVTAGELLIYPLRPPRMARRRLYLTTTTLAWADLMDRNSAVNLLGCRGFIEASLTRWVAGGRVYGDSRGRFLFRLDPPPPEIWEVRVTEPVVQARLMGRFAEPDTLILTKFMTRQLLGKKGSVAWQTAMAECANSWVVLFACCSPFSADIIHEYVTEKCDDFPI